MKQQILKNMLFLTWVFLFITFALNIFGISTYYPTITNPNLIQLIDVVNNNTIIRIFFNIIFTVLLLNLMFASVMIEYKKYLIKANIFIALYAVIINYIYFMPQNKFLDVTITFGIYFIPFLFLKKLYIPLYLFAIDSVLFAVSYFVKNLAIEKTVNDIEILIFSGVDLFLMWLLCFLYIKVGEKTWRYFLELVQDFGRLLYKKLRENLQACKLKNLSVKHARSTLTEKFLKSKSKLQNLKLYIQIRLLNDLKECVPLLIVYSIFFGYALFISKPLEALFLYIAYIKLYKLFPKNMHADFIPGIKAKHIEIACVCLTSVILCTALFLTIGGGVSVISSIVVALAVNWLSYVVRNHFDWERERPFIEQLKNWFSPKEKLIKQLSESGFKDIHIKIALLYVIDKKSMDIVADELGYSLQHCKNKWGEVLKAHPELKKKRK